MSNKRCVHQEHVKSTVLISLEGVCLKPSSSELVTFGNVDHWTVIEPLSGTIYKQNSGPVSTHYLRKVERGHEKKESILLFASYLTYLKSNVIRINMDKKRRLFVVHTCLCSYNSIHQLKKHGQFDLQSIKYVIGTFNV